MPAIDQWLIVGARRWARVMARELCGVLPPKATLQLLAESDDPDLAEWRGSSPFAERVRIVEQPVPCRKPLTGVALIVNSACRHRSAIESMLAAGYHVVGEKPLTMSRRESEQVLSQAWALGLNVFSTNTYLFARYLRILRREHLDGRRFSEIQLIWADPRAEVRHGRPKQYDSSVPVVFDVLPHIASIVFATHGGIKLRHAELAVRGGGSGVTARFACDGVTIEAGIDRNAERRVRRARFAGPGSEVTIDFSEEPGMVRVNGGTPVSADPAWQAGPRPVAGMLRSVKDYFECGATDERLSPDAALLGNDLIDSVAESYVQQQIDFLRVRAGADPGHVAYAEKEAWGLGERALPFLSKESPLRRLAIEGRRS